MHHLDSKGFKVIFENGTASAIKKNKVSFIANSINKMYLLKLELNDACTNVASSSNTEIWYKRFEHTGMHTLKILPNIVEGLDIDGRLYDSPLQCEYCIQGKLMHFPHVQRCTFAKWPLELSHSDLMGLATAVSFDGKHYIIKIIDDYTHLLLHTF